MPFLISELMMGNVNTISIPTDAIFILSLLILFALLGYFFNNILNNETNQLAQKINVNSNLELVTKRLEDQLTVEGPILDQKNVAKPNIKKINFLSSSKLLGLGSLAVVAMGGTSLLGLQHMQKSYEGINTSRANIKLENQSTKSSVSVFDFKPLGEAQIDIKKISYIDSFLSTIKSSEENHYDEVKAKQINNNFSF